MCLSIGPAMYTTLGSCSLDFDLAFAGWSFFGAPGGLPIRV